MANIYILYTVKIKGPYPKTKRMLLEDTASYDSDPIAAITTKDLEPGPPCKIIDLDDYKQRRSA